jgi:hypothetical protein
LADSDSVDKACRITQNEPLLIRGEVTNHAKDSTSQVRRSRAPFLPPEEDPNLCSTSVVNEISSVLQAGAIHEFMYDRVDTFSAPPVSLCLQIATQSLIATGRRLVLWISSQDLWPSPYVVRTNQLRYARQDIQGSTPEPLGTPYIFITTRSSAELFSILQLALRSQCVASVITPSPRITFKQSQSLSMAAKSGGVLGIFFSCTKYQNSYCSRWHIKSQISKNSSQSATITLLKKKGIQSKKRCWEIYQQHFPNTMRTGYEI